MLEPRLTSHLCLTYDINSSNTSKVTTMSKYLRLSETPRDGKVHFIANTDMKQHVRLNGYNENDVINSVHAFMCEYGIWSPKHTVVRSAKPVDFRPASHISYDISFVLVFYNKGVHAREAREKEAKLAAQNPFLDGESEKIVYEETKKEQPKLTKPVLAEEEEESESSEDDEIKSIISGIDLSEGFDEETDTNDLTAVTPLPRGKATRGRGRGRK